jgi:hypothetical protein
MHVMYSIILLDERDPPFGDAIGPPISKGTPTVVVGLEIEGDPNGESFSRGIFRYGTLRSSNKGQKHPACPKRRSSSVPFKRL